MPKIIKLSCNTEINNSIKEGTHFDGYFMLGDKITKDKERNCRRTMEGITVSKRDGLKRPHECLGYSVFNEKTKQGKIEYSSLVNISNVYPLKFRFDFQGDYCNRKELNGSYNTTILGHEHEGEKAFATFTEVRYEEEIAAAVKMIEEGMAKNIHLPRIMEYERTKYEEKKAADENKKSKFTLSSLLEMFRKNPSKGKGEYGI